MQQHSLKLSTLALAMTTALSGQALAQDEQQQDETTIALERIEVTARKQVESLQEVPVTLTSVSSAELAENGVETVTEVQQFSPNTTLQKSRGTNSTLTAFIRGVGQQDPLWGFEPGVGIYIDDVYVARPQGAVLDILDVQRIEVLRGPQGTLYGKNTIGGAVKYVTKPMSGYSEFKASATVGSYSQRDIKVSGQIPLVEDKLYFGFGFADLNRDGYGEFLKRSIPDLDNPGQFLSSDHDNENYNKDLRSMRATLEYRPTDDLFFRLAWDKTDDDSNAKGGFRLVPSLLTDAPVPDSKYDSYTSMPTWNTVEMEGLSLTAEWTASEDLILKYIASSRESYSDTNIDFDNTTLDIFDVPAFYDDENTTHEIQANYYGNGFEVVGGLYYYDGESCGHFDAILGVLGRAAFGTSGLTREVTGCNNSTSYAAYAESSIDLTEKWTLNLGGRFTNEEKDAYVNNGLIFAPVYPKDGWIEGYDRPDGPIVPRVLGEDTNGDGILDAPKSADWSRFTPRVGVEYQHSRDTMFFATFSQGFKSGTFNPRAESNEAAADPEVVDSFELGVKSDVTERLRTNVTLFTLDHKDRQYVAVLPGEDSTDLRQVLGNVGSSTADGLEADITYQATNALRLTWSLGYIDANFDEVLVGDGQGGVIDIADNFSISNTPDVTSNFAVNYSWSTDMGDFSANANYYYRGDYALFEDSPVLEQDAYGLLNLSLNWYSPSGDWHASLHGKNLTDEEYLVGGYDFVNEDPNDPTNLDKMTPGLGGDTTLIGYYGDPRTVHLTVGYRF